MNPTDTTSPAPSTFVAPQLPASAVVRNIRRDEAELAARRRDAGYSDGYRQGLEAARHEIDAAIADHRRNAERLAQCVHAMEVAADELHRRDAIVLADIEGEIMALAVELAEQLVGRELEVTSAPVLDAMARALRVLPDRGTPVLRVHPDDEQTAQESAQADLVRWRGAVTVLGDPDVEPGGCVVDIDDCRIDAQISAAVERLRAAI